VVGETSSSANNGDIWLSKHQEAPPDIIPPAAITTLTGLAGAGSVNLSWISPGDDGTVGNLNAPSQFLIRRSTWWIYGGTTWGNPADSVPSGVYEVTIATNNLAPLTQCNYTWSSLTGGVTHYFRIWTMDDSNNWSGLSKAATAYVTGGGGGIFSGDFSQVGGSVYDGGSNDKAWSIAVDTISGGGPYIFVVGNSSNGVAGDDYFTIKYNASGVMLTSSTFNSGNGDYAFGITVDNQGYVYVIGNSSTNSSSCNWVTIKYTNNLVFQSSAVFNGGEYDQGAQGIAVNNTGNVYVTGEANGNYVTMKYNNSLVFQSSAVFNGGFWDECREIAVDNNGNVYVTGGSNNGANDDCVTIKYNSNLVFQSSAVFNGGSIDVGYSIAVGPPEAGGYVYVTGSTRNGVNDDYITIKYTNNLVFQ
jgi:hypothetical protein